MRLIAVFVVALSLMIVAASTLTTNAANTSSAAQSRDGGSRTDPNANGSGIGGPFTLTNKDGQTVTEKDFLGKFQLVFFGYTFCPDICPTELQNAIAALDAVNADIAAKTGIMFISIDPKRDTPVKVGEYARQFGDNVVGLTGTPAQITAVAREYKVYYARSAESAADDPDYLMDHSSFLYLMGPDGKNVAIFRAGTDPQEIANALTAAVKAQH